MAENDAYFLAQAFFSTHQYARAEQLLTTPLRYGTARLGGSTSQAQAPPLTDQIEQRNELAGMVAEENIQGDGDALAAALAATRSSSVLPSSKFSQQSTKASSSKELISSLPGMNPISGAGSSGTARKRKERSFTVSGTGTGSSEGEGEGEVEESIDGMPIGEEDEPMLEENENDSSMNGVDKESQFPPGFNDKNKKNRNRSRNGMQVDSDTDAGGEADVEDGPKSDPLLSDYASVRENGSSRNTVKDPNLVWAEQTRQALEEVQEKEVLSPDGIILVNHSKAARYLAAQCQVSR